MRFDLEGSGLLRVMKPYQAELMRLLWRVGEATSGEGYDHLQTTPHAKSRASVIFFLNDMVEEEYVDYYDETGKGGHHKVYRPVHANEGEFRYAVATRIRDAVEAFLGEL